MIFRKLIPFLVFCLILGMAAQLSASKNTAQSIRVESLDKPIHLGEKSSFATAEACTLIHFGELSWYIEEWVTGGELYKAYQDPSAVCTGAYPFSVEEVLMVLNVHQACILNVSVDVESTDLTDPSCPTPGALLSISTMYSYPVPEAGMYLITVPLDSAAVVNEPYFVGFYLDVLDQGILVDVVTDNTPVLCTGFNVWDEAIGYVDVCNNTYFNFPGRLVLYSVGTAGGSGGLEPDPSISILTPEANDLILGDGLIWAAETSGSNIIDQVLFEYKGTSGWSTIGTDFDGASPLRNGVDNSGTGEGYSTAFNYGALNEGMYWIKATVSDDLGRTDADSMLIKIDPTPPQPTFVGMQFMDEICTPHQLVVSSPDEDIDHVTFEKKNASVDYSIPLTTLSQSIYGGGTDGQYYCGPAAGAIVVKYFFDQGYSYTMREGSAFIPVDTVVERLAGLMLTRENSGTYDENFYSGMKQYSILHGNEIRMDLMTNPTYSDFRNLLQEQELCLVLALSGTPGVYLAAAGVSGIGDQLSQYTISVSDPVSGQLMSALMKNGGSGAQVYYQNSWHDLDKIFMFWGHALSVARETIGTDNSAAFGWSYDWNPGDLTDDSLYFVRASAADAVNNSADETILITYNCSVTEGDYNGDGMVNLGDALYLTEYIYKNGSEPVGGTGRADANGDGFIDISDVIYIIKYIYDGSSEPRY